MNKGEFDFNDSLHCEPLKLLTFFDLQLVENCLDPFSFEAPDIFSQGHP